MIMGTTSAIFQIATIKLSEEKTTDVIMVREMSVLTYNIHIQEEWKKYKEYWSDEIPQYRDVHAQILLGVDNPTIFLIDVMD